MDDTSPPDSTREGRLANLQNITFGDDDDIPFDFGPPTPAAAPAESAAAISTSTNLAAAAIVEPLTTEQREAATIIDKDVLILAGPGTGKAQPVDAPVLTPTGWKPIGSLHLNDLVVTPNGSTARVIGLFPQGEQDIYELTFADGRTAESTDDHLWQVWTGHSGSKREYRVLPLATIRELISRPSAQNRIGVPLATLELDRTPDARLPIDPYLLGAYLGDGTTRPRPGVPRLTIANPDVFLECSSRLAPDFFLLHINRDDFFIRTTIPLASGRQAGGEYVRHPWVRILISLNLYREPSHRKFVPDIYKTASRAQRLELIRGLMDTDGTVDQVGHVSFTSTSERLAQDLQYLVRSIGGIAKITSRVTTYSYNGERRTGRRAYRVWIRYREPETLFTCPTKRARAAKNQQYRDCLRLGITTIRKARRAQAICIKIDSPDELYVTSDFVVTHNTKSLTSRLAYLIAGEYARPDQILAVTFTNKAAGEMAKRASALSGVSKDQLAIGTFHSICAKIIRTWPSEVGVSTKFTILNDDDQSRLIKRLLLEAHYPVSGRKKRDENTLDVEPVKAGVITSIISAWKDEGITADAAAKLPWNPLKARRDENEHHFQVAQIIYPLYNAALREQDALDFGDLLLETVLMFEKNEQIAEAYRSQFTHILVDEYQDTNKVQNRWLDQVAKNAVLACVGDDDQNIYSFRGADLQSMLDFPKRRPGSKIVRLTQNFRSTGAIVSAASRLIANNQTRYQKNLWTPTHGGQRLKAATFTHPGEEAQAIVRKLSQLHHEGSAWSEMAILVRAAWTGIEIEQELLRNKIPYVLSGKTRFLDKQEVKDALAYLRLAVKNEDDLAFERAISRPKRGFGEARIEALRAFAKQNRTPMLFAWGKFGIEAAIGKAAYQKLAEFNDFIMRARERLEQRDPLNEVIYSLLNDVGYIEMLQDEDDGAESARMPQIMTLCSLASDFQTAESFLEHIQLATDLGRGYDQDAVRVSTIHAAKGLEFETCFLAAWEEGIMPSAGATTPAQCEEERRLAFVALTRPKLRTYLSWCRMRAGRGMAPSRFFSELPEIEWKQF